jgi:hypothetical protein
MTTPCTTCIKANPIPKCADTWLIGGIPSALNGSTLFFVLTNQATGAIYTGETELVVLGEAVITLEDYELTELMAHYYKIDLYEDDTMQSNVSITIGTDEGCCIEFTTFDMTTSEVEFTNTSCA